MPKIKIVKRKKGEKRLRKKPISKPVDTNKKGEELWAVDFLFGKKFDEQYNAYSYKVKWKGWAYSSSTWEPTEHLSEITDLIRNLEYSLSRSIFRKKLIKKSDNGFEDIMEEKPSSKHKKIDNTVINEAKQIKNVLINSEKSENGTSRAQKKVKMTHLITLNMDNKGNSDIFGRIERDIPDKIIGHNLEDSDAVAKKEKKAFLHIKKFHYKLEWLRREDGTVPIPTYYSFDIIRKYYPLLLIDYLESNETNLETK